MLQSSEKKWHAPFLAPLHRAGGLKLDDHCGPFQPRPFYDSMIPADEQPLGQQALPCSSGPALCCIFTSSWVQKSLKKNSGLAQKRASGPKSPTSEMFLQDPVNALHKFKLPKQKLWQRQRKKKKSHAPFYVPRVHKQHCAPLCFYDCHYTGSKFLLLCHAVQPTSGMLRRHNLHRGILHVQAFLGDLTANQQALPTFRFLFMKFITACRGCIPKRKWWVLLILRSSMRERKKGSEQFCSLADWLAD